MRFILIAFAILLNNAALAASGCVVDMNGRWALGAEKSLDPEQLKYEVLIFKNTKNMQSYSMMFENSATDKGSLEWSAPCDGKDYASPEFPWSTAPNSTIAITRLGDKSEIVTQKESGVLTMTYTRVLADNNQTLISIGRDAVGKVMWVRIFDRED
jgi:hypothetical protein